jgi:hypothetical protein
MFEILSGIPIGQWALIMVIMMTLILLLIIVRRGTQSSQSIENNRMSASVLPMRNLGAPPAQWAECPEGEIVEFTEVGDEIIIHLEGDNRTFWMSADDTVVLDVGDCYDSEKPVIILHWEINPDGRVRVFDVAESK